MGFKYDDKAIRCPTFKRVIKTTNGQFIGIECDALRLNLGFEVSPCIRLKTSADLKDYIEIFCEDCFESCPYHKAYLDTLKKN